MGIWDTGATSTCITQKVIDDLKLHAMKKCKTSTAGGDIETTQYLVDLWLPNKIVLPKCLVMKVELYALDADVLLGMDVLSRGDFTITNYQGTTVMTFRMPSMERVDYTQQTKAFEQAPVKTGTPVGRNALCPCGSGKKFKHCCGK
jgi:uncharacterized protein YchJ